MSSCSGLFHIRMHLCCNLVCFLAWFGLKPEHLCPRMLSFAQLKASLFWFLTTFLDKTGEDGTCVEASHFHWL